jgi:hypothetical protein
MSELVSTAINLLMGNGGIGAIVLGVLGILGTLVGIRKAGARGERKKIEAEQMEANYEAEKTRDDIEDRIRGASPAERERMSNPWYRK